MLRILFAKQLSPARLGLIVMLQVDRTPKFILIACFLIGLCVAYFAVQRIHLSLAVDWCLDGGGEYIFENHTCLDGHTYEEYFFVAEWQLLIVYAFIGIFIAALLTIVMHRILTLINRGGKAT